MNYTDPQHPVQIAIEAVEAARKVLDIAFAEKQAQTVVQSIRWEKDPAVIAIMLHILRFSITQQ